MRLFQFSPSESNAQQQNIGLRSCSEQFRIDILFWLNNLSKTCYLFDGRKIHLFSYEANFSKIHSIWVFSSKIPILGKMNFEIHVNNLKFCAEYHLKPLPCYNVMVESGFYFLCTDKRSYAIPTQKRILCLTISHSIRQYRIAIKKESHIFAGNLHQRCLYERVINYRRCAREKKNQPTNKTHIQPNCVT